MRDQAVCPARASYHADVCREMGSAASPNRNTGFRNSRFSDIAARAKRPSGPRYAWTTPAHAHGWLGSYVFSSCRRSPRSCAWGESSLSRGGTPAWIGYRFVSGGRCSIFNRISSATASAIESHSIHVSEQPSIHVRTAASCSSLSRTRFVLIEFASPKPSRSATFLRNADVPNDLLWPMWDAHARRTRLSALPT